MSKLTLLCGPPQSGKTAVGIKIAQEIYYHFKGSVIYISADTVTPFMGLVFPSASEKQLYSLGAGAYKHYKREYFAAYRAAAESGQFRIFGI